MKSTITASLLAISLVANAMLAYRVFDLGTAGTSQSDEVTRRAEQTREAEKLMTALLPTTTRDALEAAARHSGLEILDRGPDNLYVGTIRFVLSNNLVSAVEFD